MNAPIDDTHARVTLRKYPNRRYYDTSRSRYVTLEEIYAMILDGCEIQVSDTRTGADITAKVLAQIILELDPPKLDIFPVPLLHRLIRSNERLVNDFVERYFNQALSLFLDSHKSVERSFRQSMGLQSLPSAMPDWLRRMWEPLAGPAQAAARGVMNSSFASPLNAAEAAADPMDDPVWPDEAAPAPSGGNHQEMKRVVEDLRHQLALLRAQVAVQPKSAKPRSNGSPAKKRARKKAKRRSRP